MTRIDGDDKRFEISEPDDFDALDDAARRGAMTWPAADDKAGSGPLWFFAPLVLFLAGALLVVATQRGVGYAWDESFYYEPAKAAARWAVGAVAGEIPLTREAVDAYWRERSEHPSFHKFVSGFSLLAFEDLIGPLHAMRLPIAFLFGLSLTLTYLLGRRCWGRFGGLIAALTFLLMPRVFGHAHFSSMETPLVFAMLLTVYCYIRGLESRGWSVLTGLALGLLVATKINGFFLIPPLVVWGYLYAQERSIHNLFAMLTLGPLTFVAMWPWLWPAPALRILEYLAFHVTHQQTALWFLGRKWGYGDANAPWFYPSVMIAVTLPLTVLGLSALGALRSAFAIRRRPLAALFLLIALTMWAVASAPGTPKYDGVRLFLPLFPFLALMAGGAAAWLEDAALRLDRRKEAMGGKGNAAALLAVGLFAVVAVDGAIALLRYHPFYLSYYNPVVGGLPGAAEKGFEATYWGEAVNGEVIETLNRELRGKNVRLMALHGLNFQHLQQWGKLSPDIEFGGDPPYYAHLLLNRRGFHGNAERALTDTALFRVIEQWDFHGVPMLTLYRTGPAFERFLIEQARLRARPLPEAPLPPPLPPPAVEVPPPAFEDAPTTAP